MKKIGLSLSGGGYRATLYALGSLWRLNDLGLLSQVHTITSVSGGAITAGYLAHKWDKLEFKEGRAINFIDEFAQPLMKFCRIQIDKPAILKGFFSYRSTIGNELCKLYDKHLYHGDILSTVAQHANAPEFIFYGTNYDTGVSVRISKHALSDYRIGRATNHNLSISKAVGISSAFPPIFSPVILDGSEWQWEKTHGADIYHDISLRQKLFLCDGGLYDNLGIEKLWKTEGNNTYDVVLVADSGAPFQAPYASSKSVLGTINNIFLGRNSFFSQFSRMGDIMINQQRALRKRQLIDNYTNFNNTESNHTDSQECKTDNHIKGYRGAYWGIDTDIDRYPEVTPLLHHRTPYKELAKLPTQLSPFSIGDQQRLIDWSYALTDAALRSYYNPNLPDDGILPSHQLLS